MRVRRYTRFGRLQKAPANRMAAAFGGWCAFTRDCVRPWL
ncbi:hypothetical protein HMPREF9123_2784 [Neisseria bacilliformis ATCC BAA-1200]|uniref:Uncharacterized protein n=1 Tax=Neisseria bacilliformis ATCC BAA-1200 TaxID=888742 RepID=F2BGC7_9NEIS|nr:hypothetical protein HMPREF9123_2784 [Neisseria bacilliformis ATCC BAA-1200]